MMDTPIWDFLQEYTGKKTIRFHMPGHKGKPFLGCEPLDLTEITGADSLYDAEGIIARSEENATGLFGSGQTFYSTEGSSQCIKAMLFLALTNRRPGTAPVIVAARNVHKAFVHAAGCLDFETVWLFAETETNNLCSCPITPQAVAQVLDNLPQPPAAVYLTSPDYLGGEADIAAIAAVCHARNTLLLVDNAHGAYLKFLSPSRHPLDLGADLCCDSAHKTLPVLTGGAYLHLGKALQENFYLQARSAMALFGSTSPSYLTLASLDLCNRYLAEGYADRLAETCRVLAKTRLTLSRAGWKLPGSDPLRLTIAAPTGCTGHQLGQRLRQANMEYEYADPEYLVLMITPENTPDQLQKLVAALGQNYAPYPPLRRPSLPAPEQVLSVRKALFSPHKTVAVENALDCICGAPTVSCPPAVPIVLSGERISREAIALFQHYGFQTIEIVEPSYL